MHAHSGMHSLGSELSLEKLRLMYSETHAQLLSWESWLAPTVHITHKFSPRNWQPHPHIVGGASNPRKFSPRFLILYQFAKVFSLKSFPLYGIYYNQLLYVCHVDCNWRYWSQLSCKQRWYFKYDPKVCPGTWKVSCIHISITLPSHPTSSHTHIHTNIHTYINHVVCLGGKC